MYKKFFICLLCFFMTFTTASAKDIHSIEAQSYVLMDGQSGKVLLEKDSDMQLPPASITKIMTMLLTLEAVDKEVISLSDIVTVSESAAIHEGSHVFLEIGEQISVDDLMKAVAVASGNDAANALAEHVSDSQDDFVKAMNKRAKELKMSNTNFVNCNGLDQENHYSSAMDVAKMTFEIAKHPEIFKYTSIWMDTLRDGAFQLANTNKLIRFYDGATGMKTGYTSNAGYCLSATAERNGISLIAVVMKSPTSSGRFGDASALLNYGFDSYTMIECGKKGQIYGEIAVEKGENESVQAVLSEDVNLTVLKEEKGSVEEKILLPSKVSAPIYKNSTIGKVEYLINGRVVGEAELVALNNSPKTTLSSCFKKLLKNIISCV
ncbi:MAG: D-alanyl-D-alanine carboxypeptidase [Clostridia bacterium]|nr:D-alanyl-D-alanine carboxypeptidase [Clostridia bacterium]